MKQKEKTDIDGKTENVRGQLNNCTRQIKPRIVIEKVNPVPITVNVIKSSNRRINDRTTITKIHCKINAPINIIRSGAMVPDSANKTGINDGK